MPPVPKREFIQRKICAACTTQIVLGKIVPCSLRFLWPRKGLVVRSLVRFLGCTQLLLPHSSGLMADWQRRSAGSRRQHGQGRWGGFAHPGAHGCDVSLDEGVTARRYRWAHREWRRVRGHVLHVLTHRDGRAERSGSTRAGGATAGSRKTLPRGPGCRRKRGAFSATAVRDFPAVFARKALKFVLACSHGAASGRHIRSSMAAQSSAGDV
jgi:hypothetical protein